MRAANDCSSWARSSFSLSSFATWAVAALRLAPLRESSSSVSLPSERSWSLLVRLGLVWLETRSTVMSVTIALVPWPSTLMLCSSA